MIPNQSLRFFPFWGLLALALPLYSIARVAEAGPPKPVAIVYSLTGKISLTAPEAARRPLRLFDRLTSGTVLEVGAGSRLELAFVNGRRYELGEDSRVTLGSNDLVSRAGPVRPSAAIWLWRRKCTAEHSPFWRSSLREAFSFQTVWKI